MHLPEAPCRRPELAPPSSPVSTRCTTSRPRTPVPGRTGTTCGGRRRLPAVDRRRPRRRPATRGRARREAATASVAIRQSSTGTTSWRAVPAAGPPGPRRRRRTRPGCASAARRRRRAGPRPCTVDGRGRPAGAAARRTTAALSSRWAAEVDVLPVAAAAAGRARRTGTAAATRSGDGLEHLDGVGAAGTGRRRVLGDPRPGPARRAARAGRRPPGRRAGRRSARRARPAPTSSLELGADQSTARGRAARRCRGPAGPRAVTGRAAPIRRSAPSSRSLACPRTSASCHGTLVTMTPGVNSSRPLSRSALWLCSSCSHQCPTTYSGMKTVTTSRGAVARGRLARSR